MAAKSCTSRIIIAEWGYLSVMHTLSVICKNITINHILPKTRFFGLHFCCRLYWSTFTHFDVTNAKATKFGKIMAIMLFKVIQIVNFGTNGKPICKFFYMNNSNLPPSVHCFRYIVNYWSYFHSSFKVNPRIQDSEIWPQETSHVPLLYDVKFISISCTV